jgi:hypothetical protein
MTRETKRIIIFVFGLAGFICFPISLVAQKSEKQFGIGTGLYYHDFRDASIATKSQTGSSVSLILLYRASGIKNRHHVQLLYAAPSLRSTYLLAKEQTGYLQYAYHRKLLTVKSFIFFGGSVMEFGGASRKYSEIGNLLSSNSPYLDVEVLGIVSPSFLVEKTFGKAKLSLQMWIPFIGFITNNPGRLRDAKLTGLNDLRRMDVRFSYSRFFPNVGVVDWTIRCILFA